MYTLVALIVFVQTFQASSKHYGYKDVEIPECDNYTIMNHNLRRDITYWHNSMRSSLQMPWRENDRDRLPNSSHMNLLNYDCELERTAYNIAQSCPDNSNPSFDYTGSNNYTGELLYEGYYASFVLRAYWSWYSTWEANKNETPLEDLKPTNKNAPMIPFLQTMVGNMTKLGCAFNLNCINSTNSSFVSFVCQYGEPHVKLGIPIYTNGTPCSECADRCIDNTGLCNSTTS
ncbi:hypothetical protein KIN20_016089 [Parelaphostrongylus tenuis]|uniref:SCP domain-containing protein n=1 Tax=Parelaphostrongylus tenuis TaxID=148309 RepID=A0AAD5QPH8_PARTN|nr:hypothetical protein KIN20_016089 [Parelaphostrongylus tenuis]